MPKSEKSKESKKHLEEIKRGLWEYAETSEYTNFRNMFSVLIKWCPDINDYVIVVTLTTNRSFLSGMKELDIYMTVWRTNEMYYIESNNLFLRTSALLYKKLLEAIMENLDRDIRCKVNELMRGYSEFIYLTKMAESRRKSAKEDYKRTHQFTLDTMKSLYGGML